MLALLGTRKGLIIAKKATSGKSWSIAKTFFEGVKVPFATYEPRSKAIWAGVNHGHWGPKLHVSKDKGKTFSELGAPKFPEATKESLKDIWSLASDSTGRIYVGTEPAALFYSDDQGKKWTFCEGFNKTKGKDKWFGAGTDATCLHSLIVDPDDDKHIVVGISVAGVLETRDRGETWAYINKGLKAEYLPDADSEVGQDPHMIVAAPSDANVLWQQNHCGIFKSEDMGKSWTNLSKSKGLKSAFGWGIAVDEKDPRVAFTVPALSDESRVPIKKRLLVQVTKDGGKSWKALDNGFPKATTYDIVYRHALSLKGKDLMFGSTTGNVFFSGNGGAKWQRLNAHLPPVFSVKLM